MAEGTGPLQNNYFEWSWDLVSQPFCNTVCCPSCQQPLCLEAGIRVHRLALLSDSKILLHVVVVVWGDFQCSLVCEVTRLTVLLYAFTSISSKMIL